MTKESAERMKIRRDKKYPERNHVIYQNPNKKDGKNYYVKIN